MLDKGNLIFTGCKQEISQLCTSASQTFQETPPSFPHFYMKVLDNPSTADDMENNENAVSMSLEITVYTQGSSRFTDAKKIHNLSDTYLRLKGFIRNYGPTEVTNTSDTNICRVIARYSRVIGSDDNL